MTDAVALEMRGVTKAFPGVIALNNVDLTLRAGEVHVLLGENGAGKSTLVKILSGAYRMDAGEIRIAGTVRDIRSPRHAIDLGIRIIYQELSLVPALSIAENLFLGALPTKLANVVDRRALQAATRRVLDALGLDLSPSMPVRELSLAQRQMVEIARAVKDSASGGPPARILVMDEPTSALTSREVDRLFSLIGRLTARGVAIVYITHRLDEVYRIGHRVTVLRDGRRIGTHALADVTLTDLVRAMANRDVGEHFPRVRPPADGDVLLALDGVYRSGTLHDISFTVRAGEVVGIAGSLGAGRSELARVIAGADHADGGRITVRGTPVTIRSPRDAIRCGIGLLPEDREAEGLVPRLTVSRNVALPHEHHLARMGILPRGADDAFARPIAETLRIKASPGQPVTLLSGGNQQKVVLGKWVAGNARIFIFDEPTRGVDVGAKEEIYHLMNRLTAGGAGVIMISSELPELLGMSDRILVMRAGRICAELDATTATEERVLAAALGVS